MQHFIPTPLKAIPLDLDESFTTAEFLAKLSYKINEIILNVNNLNITIQELKEYIDTKAEETLQASKTYTDEQIAQVLNYKTITAEDYDNLELTAQGYDNFGLTAYQYDTESKDILIINVYNNF